VLRFQVYLLAQVVTNLSLNICWHLTQGENENNEYILFIE